MQINLHTHTFRCRHASGLEREYIENAIKSGIKILGFSDHVPYPFPDGHESGFRILKKDLADYIETIKKLKEEYKNDIHIMTGFEAEYYPKYFGAMLSLIAPYKPEYLILGQHFTDNEEDGLYTGTPNDNSTYLQKYVNQVTEAISTGRFTYIAHPDIYNFTGDEEIYKEHMKKLCIEAKKLHIPLEFNFLGFTDHRPYPCKRFFRIVAEIGNDVILGCDAHKPDVMLTERTVNGALEFLEDCGIKPVDSIDIKYLNL